MTAKVKELQKEPTVELGDCQNNCPENPNTGEIYTCSNPSCPVHGKRNIELGFYRTYYKLGFKKN